MNFFVGENSTGKTSVMKLINLFSQPLYSTSGEFDFNAPNIVMGYFEEIANFGEDFFEIGIENDSSNSEIKFLKLHFINNKGIPFLNGVSIFNHNIDIEIKIVEIDKQASELFDIGYRYSLSHLETDTQFEFSTFEEWVKNDELQKSNFNPIGKSNFSSASIVRNLIRMIRSIITSNKLIANELSTLELLDFTPFAELKWFAPIRTEPKRTYDNYVKTFRSDGEHTPYLLKELLELENLDHNKINNNIEIFGKESGLYEKIEILSYGDTSTAPFEIRFLVNGHPLKITNLGYGVSQIIPIIIEIVSRPPGEWFAIQQPEIHLHPRAQAAFGEFVYAYTTVGNNFIIETHSDYLIDRYRLCLNKQANRSAENQKKFDSQIVFFKQTLDGNELIIIPINEDGSYPEDQPKEFREFFIKEQLDLLSI